MKDFLITTTPQGVEHKFTLERSQVYTAGRAGNESGEGRLTLLDDPRISRSHFEMRYEPSGWKVRRLEAARNPLLFNGQLMDEFALPAGGVFVVGETRCRLQGEDSLDRLRTEFTLMGPTREAARRRQGYQCLQAMVALLPELRRANVAEQVWECALRVLKSILTEASVCLAMRLEADGDYEVLARYPADGPGAATPSRRLLQAAFDQHSTVTHVWDSPGGGLEATSLDWAAWAVAAPIAIGEERYALYALGARSSFGREDTAGQVEQLGELSALVDIVAETVSHHLLTQHILRVQSQVGQFFSPVMRRMLGERELAQALTPTRREVSVLFFDLRGFSRATEQAEQGAQGDPLESLLRYHGTLTEVMTTITECVFAEEGVAIDYQGDALLACWGAPISIPDHAERAVRTALAIVERVYAMDLPFWGGEAGRMQRCGIGLGSGEVIAGQIGARDQAKFGVMGRVVNQSSRLEGLTKVFGVPVLANAALVERLPEGYLRRRIGKVRPAGVSEAGDVFEIVVPSASGGTGLSAAEVAAYANAYGHFEQRAWMDALQCLRELPVTDPVGGFLTRRILQCQHEGVPAGSEGILEFQSK